MSAFLVGWKLGILPPKKDRIPADRWSEVPKCWKPKKKTETKRLEAKRLVIFVLKKFICEKSKNCRLLKSTCDFFVDLYQ